MNDSPPRRDRLDRVLVERGLAENATRARALILAGRVVSEGRRLDKAGNRVPVDLPLEVSPGRRYVGRGAHKLAGALDAFRIEARDRPAIDVGASTGGFTQVWLEAGASPVIAVDVGRGQLDWTLRQDPRVVVLEGVNARHLDPATLPLRPSCASIDVSFISIERILPALVPCLEDEADIVALVKPQFEVGKGQVGRGGIVRDPDRHREVLTRVIGFCVDRGWGVRGAARSAIEGADGNREFFLHIRPAAPSVGDLEARVDRLCTEAP